MEEYQIQKTTLDGIANAINEKTGETGQMTALQMEPKIRSIQTGGFFPEIIVTAPTGSTVTATKGSTTLIAAEASGTWTFKVPEYGTWTVRAVNGTDTREQQVGVSTVQQYLVTITFDYTAYTSVPSGSQIQAGIVGLSASTIKKCANAIASNSNITNTTSVCYVDTGSGYYTISIGDQISWTMNGTSYPYRIMGFNHYDKSDGNGKSGILFQMVNCYNTKYYMKSNTTSGDGWDDSDLRTTLNSTLYGYLPSDVQAAISSVTVKTAKDVSTSTKITTNDKLFVPAEVEVFGSTQYAIGGTGEGVWYPWYKANNSSSNRIKKVNGSSTFWWERSPSGFDLGTSDFCGVGSGGGADYQYADVAFGASPCFCF